MYCDTETHTHTHTRAHAKHTKKWDFIQLQRIKWLHFLENGITEYNIKWNMPNWERQIVSVFSHFMDHIFYLNLWNVYIWHESRNKVVWGKKKD